MKKIRFLVNVPDKYTREEYKEGQEKEFEDKRAEEILKARRVNGQAYAELVEEIKEIETATKKVKAETAVNKTRTVKSIEIDLDKGTVKENE
ncbi:MAG: hypothetical protein V8R30_05350 [Clostridia bacterium]|jgi:hypothetical protein